MTAYVLESSTPSINLQRFDELRKLLGQDMRQLLAIYREDTQDRLETLNQAISQGDSVQVLETAHSLKSASANIALERMAGWACKLEEMGRSDTLLTASSVLEELRKEYAVIEVFLDGVPLPAED